MLTSLTTSVHDGLRDAWVFAFEASDTPATPPKPEYVCTTTVAQRIVDLELPRAIVLLEQNVQLLAAGCLSVPPLPRLHPKPRIPPRKTGSRGDRERVDIVVQDRGAGILEVPRACVELKVNISAGGLREDLARNRMLMELSRPVRDNQLDAALLGFVVANTGAIGAAQGAAKVSAITSKYVELARTYVSPSDAVEVSVVQASAPPDEPDEEFIHIVSVIIAFARGGHLGGLRFRSNAGNDQVVVVELTPTA